MSANPTSDTSMDWFSGRNIMRYDARIGLRHCETTMPNSTCPYLARGCRGCAMFPTRWELPKLRTDGKPEVQP